MKTLQHYIVAIIPAYLASYSKLFTCFYNWLWYSNFTMSSSIDQKDWPGLPLCIVLLRPFAFGLEILFWRLLMLKFRIWLTLNIQTKVCAFFYTIQINLAKSFKHFWVLYQNTCQVLNVENTVWPRLVQQNVPKYFRTQVKSAINEAL